MIEAMHILKPIQRPLHKDYAIKTFNYQHFNKNPHILALYIGEESVGINSHACVSYEVSAF